MNKQNKMILLISAFVAIIFLGIGFSIGNLGTTNNEEDNHQEHDLVYDEVKEVWTCSMHPQIKLPEAGPCPICGMDLIPLESPNKNSENNSTPGSLELSPYAQKLAQIKTSVVIKKKAKIENEYSGKIDWDDSKLKVESAKISGRVEKLYFHHAGQKVSKGQRLVDVYSPEIVSLGVEYEQIKQFGDEELLNSVLSKLALLGIKKSDLEKMIESKSTTIPIRAQYTGELLGVNILKGQYFKEGASLFKIASKNNFWIHVDVYEKDLKTIRVGDHVDVVAEGVGQKVFKAKVDLIHPHINPLSQSNKVRIVLSKSTNELIPGMLVKAKIKSKEEIEKLFIPTTSVLFTGEKSWVYIETSPGNYNLQEVVVGPQIGNDYQVVSGLLKSEKVVTRGAFKIDATRQINGMSSIMDPDVEAMGHSHE